MKPYTTHFRVGRYIHYQHDAKFLFWKNDLYITVGYLHLTICWSRTYVWSDNKTRRFKLEFAWCNGYKYKTLFKI